MSYVIRNGKRFVAWHIRAVEMRRQGRTFPEIAAELGVERVETVRKTVYRTERRLKGLASDPAESVRSVERVRGWYDPDARMPRIAPRPCRNGVHPAISFLRDEQVRQRCSDPQLERRSGIGKDVLVHWRMGRRQPTIGNIEAVLNTLGYRLVAVPIEGEAAE